MTYELKNQEKTYLQRAHAFVRESISDNETDFTVGPIGRALGLLAIPMMLEMAMEAVFAVVDIAFVSRLGTNAIAAIGLTEALITVLYAVAGGLGMAVTAMVSRRIGAKDRDAAAHVTGQAIWIGAVLAVAIGVGGVIYAADLLRMMGASEGVVAEGQGFMAMLLGGSASIIYLFLLNAAFRGAGDAPVALRSLTLANALNIALDPCLIFGLGPFPEMGVTGAAVATTIGRGIGVAYLAYCLFGGTRRLQIRIRHLVPAAALMLRMIRISAGGVGQFLISTSSWIAVMRIVALYGSAPIAAYTVGLRIIEFAILPAWGLGNAAATLVGQNHCHRRRDDFAGTANRVAILDRTRGHSLWHELPQDPGSGLPHVCGRHDYHPGTEWRRRYDNAVSHELHLFLAAADTARLLAGNSGGLRSGRRLPGDRDCRKPAHRDGCGRVQDRQVATRPGLTRASFNQIYTRTIAKSFSKDSPL
jgi:putative MATE family efflux protein